MSFQNRYGRIERLLHRVAFSTRTAQIGMADLEERMFRAELDKVRPGAPVLVTSLPRAGTTILLEVLAAMPSFATHTYRDMPFVLCPMMWSRLSQSFRRKDQPRERAHQDGIMISLDSPEAFEEMVWMAFWSDHYRQDRIEPWASCEASEFLEFFADHRRKIIALRGREKPRAHRYASKNNVNIARIPALLAAMPSATLLVPVREPSQHANSLLRQHQRFTALHAEDDFARRYMAGIGHFDFGANLKPIDFGDWYDRRSHRDPFGLAFWLEYWLATYSWLLACRGQPRLHFVAFESLGTDPVIDALAAALELDDPEELRAQRQRLKPPPDRDIDTAGVPTTLMAAARDLHRALIA